MRDPGPMARFDALVAEEGTMGVIVQRVAEGETLKSIAKAWQVPYGRLAQWIAGDERARGMYEGALMLGADALAQETLAISDEQALAVGKNGAEYDPDVARDTLRIKTRQWLASKLDRERYGEKVVGGGGGGVKVVLVNFVQDAQGRVVEGSVTQGGVKGLEAAAEMVAVNGSIKQVSQANQGD